VITCVNDFLLRRNMLPHSQLLHKTNFCRC